jgi:HEAT repeat protein
MSLRYFVFALLGGLALAAVGAAAEPDQAGSDAELLRGAGLGTDGPALVDYFKKRTVNDLDRNRIGKLIRDFASEDFDTREKASAALTAIGAPARPQLKDATKDAEVEVARRAQACLDTIDKVASPQYLCAAARLLAHRRTDDAAEVLLAFLPNTEDETVADAVIDTLKVVGFKDGRPDPALLKALADKSPARRGGAAEALWRGGRDDERKAVRKLLEDPDPAVRLRVALAMFDAHEKDSLPALIALIADAPGDTAYRAESALYAAAGDKAPQGSLSGAEARKKYRDAWDAWYKANGKNVDLAKIEQTHRQLGFTVMAELNQTGTVGRVVELDQKGKVRWQIENLKYPVDAQVLPGGDKVLIAEYTGRAVTERNLKGEVLWTKTVQAIVLGARRLPDGNTFIVSRSQLLEVDKDGKEVLAINRNDVAAAVKLRDGEIGMLTTAGRYVRLDATGKELKSFNAGQILSIGGHFEVLPNGRVIVPQYSQNRVVEFDAEGKQLWAADLQQPTSVRRLPNGNTLVASRYGRYVVELDRNGKEVSRVTPEGRPMSLERR